MTQIIYVDVLLAVNLFINYFLLLGTARFLNLSFLRRRLLLAAALGALFSLYIFFPEIHVLFASFVKILMSATLVFAAFGYKTTKGFLKTSACFFVVSFGFAGLMFALWQLFSPPGLTMNNGIFYFDISPVLLVGFTLLCYLILRILHRFSSQPVPQNLFCMVEIENGEDKVSFRAKVDTGNNLCEPFSHLPVIVVEYKTVKKLLGSQEPEEWRCPCRVVPFYAVGSEGVLPAFHPNQVCIYHDKSVQKKDAYVAVCPEGTLGDTGALMNPLLLT